ncbi:MAG: tyrosine-type recombinase/integrase [bacterium]
MQGSIRKVDRKNGHKWRVEIDLPRGDREKRQKKVKIFDKKRRAERWLAKINNQIQNKQFVEPSRQPLGEFLDEFLEDYCKHNVTENTRARYKNAIQRHIKPSIGDIPLKDLTTKRIQKYYNHKMESGGIRNDNGLASSTVRKHHVILHKALDMAVKWGDIRANPTEAVDPPKSTPTEKTMNYMDTEQTHRFLELCDTQDWYGSVLKVAVLTGLRMEELRGMRWKDLDMERGTLSIVKTVVTTTENEHIVKEPKSSESNRTVSIPQRTLTILQDWKVTQHKQRMELGSAWEGDDGRIFTTQLGTIPHPTSFRRSLKNVLERGELPDLRFHDLRHTHATIMLEQGQHPKVVAERLGHSSVQVTLDRYSHALPNMQDDAAQAVEDAIFQSQPDAQTG